MDFLDRFFNSTGQYSFPLRGGHKARTFLFMKGMMLQVDRSTDTQAPQSPRHERRKDEAKDAVETEAKVRTRRSTFSISSTRFRASDISGISTCSGAFIPLPLPSLWYFSLDADRKQRSNQGMIPISFHSHSIVKPRQSPKPSLV